MARGPSKKGKPPPRDHNEAEMHEIIKTNTDAIIGLKKQRKAINDQIAAKKSEIKGLNIDMDAFQAGARRYEMDPDVRDEFDRSMETVNAALGIKFKSSLFDDDTTGSEIPAGADA